MKDLTRQKFIFVKVSLVIVILFMLQAPLQSLAAPFQSETRYSAGSMTYDLNSADYNGDGHLDLAAAVEGSSSISVRLGIGDGTFGPQVTYGVGGAPRAITNADFNGDGNIDLATANYNSNSVSILLGNGDGTFASTSVTPVGARPQFIAAADFNKDGNMDLTVTLASGSNVYILQGNGDGTFHLPVSFSAMSVTSQVATGDFNEDGNPDLVVSSFSDNVVSVLLGNGDGTFAPKEDYSTSQYTQRVVTGDLNKDGHLDLVAVNSSGSISILLGNGDGTFKYRVNQNTRSADPRAVVIGNFVGDEEVDILVGNFGSSNFSIFSGRGDGTFETAATYNVGINTIYNLVSGDYNGDSVLDVAFVTQNYNDIHVLLGNHRNADLQSLSLSGGAALNPAFSTSTPGYTSSVAYNVYNISVTSAVYDPTASVTVQVYGVGVPELLASGGTSSALPLNVGLNTIDVVVTAQDGTTIKTYTVNVTRQSNTDASLSGLSLSGGAALSTAFSPSIFTYTSSVPYSQSSVQVTPVADVTAVVAVKVNGGLTEVVAGGGTSSALPLNVGLNTIDVVVTAQDGTTIQTYTLNVTRQSNTDASLSGLSLSGGAALSTAFSPSIFTYTSSVPYSQSSVQVTPVADVTAVVAVKVNGGLPEVVAGGGTSSALPLNVGLNTIDVVVTAQDGTTIQTYTVNVTRESDVDDVTPPSRASTNANLSGLSLTQGAELSPAFTPGTLKYTSSAANNISNFSVIPTLADGRASVKIRVNGSASEIVSSGSASSALPLNIGTNVIDVIVTAEDGRSQSYTIILIRQAEAGAEPQLPACIFTDILRHWAKTQICEAAGLGIVEGVSANTFAPNREITRTEFVVMLLRALRIPISEQAGALPFSDKESIPAWAASAIFTGTAEGMLDGYPDGTFRPQQTITRSEMAVMIARVMKWKADGEHYLSYADGINIPDWARPYVGALHINGLLQGREGNRFEPNGITTRAEAAVVMLRLWDSR
jgi:hypothetical protein